MWLALFNLGHYDAAEFTGNRKDVIDFQTGRGQFVGQRPGVQVDCDPFFQPFDIELHVSTPRPPSSLELTQELEIILEELPQI